MILCSGLFFIDFLWPCLDRQKPLSPIGMSSKKKLLKLIVVFYSLMNILVGFALVLLSVAFVSTGYTYLQPRGEHRSHYLHEFYPILSSIYYILTFN